MEIQQSPLYAKYVEMLGWKVQTIDEVQVFLKHFLLLGTLAKIQRPTKLPPSKKLIQLLSLHRVRKVAIEPDPQIAQTELNRYSQSLKKHFRLNTSAFLPTKTIRIDLTPSMGEIFNHFSEAKRRAVRRAQKNNLRICESSNINQLIYIKNKSAGFLGFITTYGIDKLWKIFSPRNAAILLAYEAPRANARGIFSAASAERNPPKPKTLRLHPRTERPWFSAKADKSNSQLVGGVLILFWDQIAYYWIAAATREGKKLFAPTLLVWEAVKLAKNKDCSFFDLVGVYDERRPRENRAWQGFTNFKEGFGGRAVYYPLSIEV